MNQESIEIDLDPEVQDIQRRVVGMYSEHPWPLDRNTEEEMGLRLKCLGIVPDDYVGKDVVEMGCGTGQYALWYATNGARHVTGIDLSDGSLSVARSLKEAGKVKNIDLLKMDILNCGLPDEGFDYAYSVGVLHHTGDTYRGFKHLVRVTKPGGTIIVSLYNLHSNRVLRAKQWVLRQLAGDDLDRRVKLGEKLFPGTIRRMDKRYHGKNTKHIAYDMLAFPHATFHTAHEILKWFDENDIEYKGSFAPLRFRDYFYAFAQPEFAEFRGTFDGFPGLKLTADFLTRLAPKRMGEDVVRNFPRPRRPPAWLIQNLWMIFGLRFNCFTISGVKKRR